MNKNKFLVLALATALLDILSNSVALAGEAPAPEIPVGFGPIIVSGLAFSAAAIKNYFDNRK